MYYMSYLITNSDIINCRTNLYTFSIREDTIVRKYVAINPRPGATQKRQRAMNNNQQQKKKPSIHGSVAVSRVQGPLARIQARAPACSCEVGTKGMTGNVRGSAPQPLQHRGRTAPARFPEEASPHLRHESRRQQVSPPDVISSQQHTQR